MIHRLIHSALSICLLLGIEIVGFAAPPFEIDQQTSFHVELTETSPLGEASIREHSIVWHPVQRKYYLVADVVLLDSPHHPNSYDTELHLWSSSGLTLWTYHGVAIEKGQPGESYDGYGVASPAGMVFSRGRLYVPFSARRTSRFEERGIGIAVSGTDPEELPWTKTTTPVSDLPGEDDDPALLVLPDDDSMHLYHRRTGPGGYQVVHTSSKTPLIPDSWPAAQVVTPRPQNVRAQELTGVYTTKGKVYLLLIEHLVTGGTQIAHLTSNTPVGSFEPAEAEQRYLPPATQPRQLAYSGHISPVVRDGSRIAFFWTVPQMNHRYGLQGHPIRAQHGDKSNDEKERPVFDTDLIWTEAPMGKPVIERGPEGAWDHYAVDNPTVFVEDGVFYCFFEAQDKPFSAGGGERIGLATSRDAVTWTKSSGNPIIDVGQAGAWDSVVAKLPTVTKFGDRYYLFYSGRDGQTKQIGVATSNDLKQWTKHSANPVLPSQPNAWDSLESTHPTPIFERDGSYYLLYRGMESMYRQQAVGVAVSTDLIHWKRVKQNPVILPSEETASLAVVKTASGYFGLSQTSKRPYWHSRDLIDWKKVGTVHFSSPKVDTASNPFRSDNQWTVLYEQQDRIYRAVLRQE